MARKAEYKPLLFTTTIRNPERFKDFMFILHKYNGKILTEELIKQVEMDIFTVGLYRPTRRLPHSVKEKWSTTNAGEFSEEALTPEEALQVYENNDSQRYADIKGHKEAGFAKGWPSRFDTQYKLMKTLGFVRYAMDEPIVFSEIGMYLAESIAINISEGYVDRHASDHPQYEQMAFMQAFAKYQRCNPYVRELNDNIPLILLLQVIQLLNKNSNYHNCGISYKELPLVIFWKNNDAEALYERIVKLRKDFGYSPSDEVIGEICVDEILGGFKKFKLKSIVSEYPDEFVRKMRMTGLVSFRGAGRFIDVNHVEDNKISYILKTYSSYSKYETEERYFEYMSKIDSNLFLKESIMLSKNDAEQKLINWTTVYNWSKITEELNNLEKKSASKDAILKFLAAPTRLEFLTALAIKLKLPNVQVVPNYTCDDEGLPTSTAGGNKADIECYEKPHGIIVEVTMAEGRRQTMMEVWPIARHLSDFTQSTKLKSQCVFVAPTIFTDSNQQIEFVNKKEGPVIRAYDIRAFINYLGKATHLFLLDTNTLAAYPEIREFVFSYMSMDKVSSVEKISYECIVKFGEKYPDWGPRDWHKLLLPFFQRTTHKPSLNIKENFDCSMVAEEIC